MRIAVIGAGISGLSVAYFLKKKGNMVEIYEMDSRAGGKIKTYHENGFLYEAGPNTFLMNEFFENFIRELGLESEVLFSDAKTRYILKNERLIPLPLNPVKLLNSSLLSIYGKARIFLEIFKRGIPSTVSDFFAYRFGREVLDYMVEPFIAGTFAGDPDRLLLKYAFPEVYNAVKKYSSLLLAAKNLKPGGRLISFKNGAETIVKQLAGKLGNIHFNSEIKNLKEIDADAYVLSIPAYSVEKLLNIELGIRYVDVVIVFAAFKKSDIGFPAEGFGFLVPRIENKFILGCLFSSQLFPFRAPTDTVLFTVYTGGARNPYVFNMNDDLITINTLNELNSILKIKSNPVFLRILRIKDAIPQYEAGYEYALEKIQEFSRNKIYICSNFIGGISSPQCVFNAFKLAEKLV